MMGVYELGISEGGCMRDEAYVGVQSVWCLGIGTEKTKLRSFQSQCVLKKQCEILIKGFHTSLEERQILRLDYHQLPYHLVYH